MNGTYKILLVLVALSLLLGGAMAMEARNDAKFDRDIKPHLEYIKTQLVEIKMDIRRFHP